MTSQNSTFIFLFYQFINLNIVIRILVTQIKYRMNKNDETYFQLYFLIEFGSILKIFKRLMRINYILQMNNLINVLDFIRGMKVWLLNFNFISLPNFNAINLMKYIDFEQDNSYLQSISLESGSIGINIYYIIGTSLQKIIN